MQANITSDVEAFNSISGLETSEDHYSNVATVSPESEWATLSERLACTSEIVRFNTGSDFPRITVDGK